MRIRYKVLLILSVFMIALLGSLAFFANIVLNTSITESENIRATENAERFTRSLDLNLNSLNGTVKDWAEWDDTYFFMQDTNTDYIESNLMDATFNNLQLNMMLFFDQSNSLMYGKLYDLSNQTEIPCDEQLINQIKSRETLFTENLETSQQGLIAINNVPMLVASNPILTSHQSGPTHGNLIIGRYIDNSMLEVISSAIGLPISILPFNELEASEDFQLAKENLSINNQVFTQPLNETAVAGYILLNDIGDNPLFIAKITDYRLGNVIGTSMLTYLSIFSFVILIILFIVVAVSLDKIVISRVSHLNDVVQKIRKTGDNSKRVAVSGNDELSNLSENINGMLNTIDKYTVSLEETVRERTKALYENQEKLKTIILASPDAIVATDLEGNITECNNKLVELSGLSRDALLGKSVYSLITEETSKSILDKLQKNQKDNAPSHFETNITKQNGVTYPAELSVNTITDNQENPIGYVAIVRDLTEKKLLEKRLLKSERLATIGQLAGLVGHDLRNPLAAIKNANYFLKKKCSDHNNNQVVPMLGTIDKSIEHANNIVNNLLEYSKELTLDEIQCSPKQLLKKALSSIKLPENIILVDSTGNYKLKVDDEKMVRVFVNLINNAVDAMPKGGQLEVKSSKKVDGVVVTFADTGGGIPKDQLRKICTPLFTTKAQGMGFGLAISSRIVEAHGGQLSVESTLGEGSKFILVIPNPKKSKQKNINLKQANNT